MTEYTIYNQISPDLLDSIKQTLSLRQTENNVALYILQEADKQLFLRTQKQDGEDVIVALRSNPPHNLFLAVGKRFPDSKTIDDFAHSLHLDLTKSNYVIPGVVGNRKLVEQFNSFYCRYSGRYFLPTHEMTVLQTSQKNNLNKADGFARSATNSDIHLLTTWQLEMMRECHLLNNYAYDSMKEKTLETIDQYYVWENENQPCSMLKGVERGTNMALTNVYTPEKFRRKGFCTSLVAEFTNFALNKYPSCVLTVDNFNPVSNHIYHKVGYSSISTMLEGTFLHR